jgi:hypothetical protein
MNSRPALKENFMDEQDYQKAEDMAAKMLDLLMSKSEEESCMNITNG